MTAPQNTAPKTMAELAADYGLAPNEYQFSLFKDAMEIFEAVVSNNKIIITSLLTFQALIKMENEDF